jgi:hypothetical protein
MRLGWIYAARPMTYGLLSSNILLVFSSVIRAMAMIARFEPERVLIRSYFLRIARIVPYSKDMGWDRMTCSSTKAIMTRILSCLQKPLPVFILFLHLY